MALFLLKQKVKEGHRPGVNEIVSLVVRASNEEKAREFAAQHSKGAESPQVWRDSQFSSCEEIVSNGAEMVVLQGTWPLPSTQSRYNE
jgi:hypothetical protein